MEPASPFLSLFRGQWRFTKESASRDKNGRVNYYATKRTAILSFKETSMVKLEYSMWCSECSMFCVKVFSGSLIDVPIFLEYNLSD